MSQWISLRLRCNNTNSLSHHCAITVPFITHLSEQPLLLTWNLPLQSRNRRQNCKDQKGVRGWKLGSFPKVLAQCRTLIHRRDCRHEECILDYREKVHALDLTGMKRLIKVTLQICLSRCRSKFPVGVNVIYDQSITKPMDQLQRQKQITTNNINTQTILSGN